MAAQTSLLQEGLDSNKKKINDELVFSVFRASASRLCLGFLFGVYAWGLCLGSMLGGLCLGCLLGSLLLDLYFQVSASGLCFGSLLWVSSSILSLGSLLWVFFLLGLSFVGSLLPRVSPLGLTFGFLLFECLFLIYALGC